jgi:hypothetical protein
LVFAAALFSANAMGGQPVIPGAAGFGMETPAGRGGEIIRVTNLNDTGSGSFRSCAQAAGPRICIFEVSGTIRLKSNVTIRNPNLTIAGQTAPAPGIMLRGASLTIGASDVLVQHLALRAGDDLDGATWGTRDSLKINASRKPVRNVVIDHCSLSWSIDELVEVVGGEWDNITLSNNILAEPLRLEAGSRPKHGFAALIAATSGKISLIGNLFAHGYNRNPKSAAGNFVFVNNVVYNAGAAFLSLVNQDRRATKNSIVGNVFAPGSDSATRIPPIKLAGAEQNNDGSSRQLTRGTDIYLFDNAAAGSSSDPWSIVLNLSGLSVQELKVSSAPAWPSGLRALPTANNVARNYVLDNAGARPAQRGVVDTRIVAGVKNGSGRIVSCVANDGTSKCARNAGGWPTFANNSRRLSVPKDPDGDSDRDGYTNMDEWLQAMAADVEGRRSGSRSGTASAPPNPPELQGTQR